MKKNKGFTLVELIVTIALLGILGTVIAINMVGLNKNQEEKENTRMSSIVQAAAEAYIEKKNVNCVSVATLIEEGYLKADDVKKYSEYAVYPATDGEYELSKDVCNPEVAVDILILDANGGKVNNQDTLTITLKNKKYENLIDAERTGYGFQGWYTDKVGGTEIEEGRPINLSSGKQTLYAHWTAKEYTLSFDANGGTINESERTRTIKYDSQYGNMPTPTKTGYDLAGWYTDMTSGDQIQSTDKYQVDGNQTLFAHWTAQKITINFNANGGTVSPSSRQYTYGQAYGSFPTATKPGYTFLGWYTDIDEGTEINTNSIMNYSTSTTLYAHWQTNEYTLSFDANGGTISENEKSRKITYGSQYGNLPTPTRANYTFSGWYTTATGGSKITATNTYNVADNQTLYAHWTGKSVTINFNANGGTVSPSSRQYTYGQAYGSFPTATKTGYDFKGWYTSSSGGTKVNATSIMNYATPVTLYAHWTAKTFTVYFNVNGGSNLSFSSKKVTYGSTYGDLPTANPPASLKNYPLDGWFTDKDGGTKITPTTTVTITSDQTLYAQYRDNTPPSCVPDKEITVYSSPSYWNDDYGLKWYPNDNLTGSFHVKYGLTCQDSGSGCVEASKTIDKRVQSRTRAYLCEYYPVPMADQAGNESFCFLNTKLDFEPPYTPILVDLWGESNVYSATYSCTVSGTNEVFSSQSPKPNLKTRNSITCKVDIIYNEWNYYQYNIDGNFHYTVNAIDDGAGVQNLILMANTSNSNNYTTNPPECDHCSNSHLMRHGAEDEPRTNLRNLYIYAIDNDRMPGINSTAAYTGLSSSLLLHFNYRVIGGSWVFND